MMISSVFCVVCLSRQKVLINLGAPIFITWFKANKILTWASAHVDILFALNQVIKIGRYENLPCNLPAKMFCLVCT